MANPKKGKVYLEKRGEDHYRVNRVVNRITPSPGSFVTSMQVRGMIESGTEVVIDPPKNDRVPMTR